MEAKKFAKLMLSKKKYQHSKRVSSLMSTKSEKKVAILHDVLERCPSVSLFATCTGYHVSNRLLGKVNLSDEEHEALVAITRLDSETYQVYIERVKTSELAVKIKLSDILDRSLITKKHLKAVKVLLKG